MKRITMVFTILLAIPLLGQSVDRGREDMKEATRTATEALATLQGLAEKNPAVIGLRADEAKTAQLGTPLRVYWVGLEALKNYSAGTDPQTLLQDMKTVFYPVTVGTSVRSSITVKERNSKLVATDFGQSELAKRVTNARGAGDGILVRVPALNSYFVGTMSGGALVLTPIADVPGTELRANVAAPADAVFTVLAGRARASNGLPT
ncbi:MAG TPA: hypothetical protein VGJ82_12960 [Thermoanaerobaculia bacterium]|jgi:hypothetical protein